MRSPHRRHGVDPGASPGGPWPGVGDRPPWWPPGRPWPPADTDRWRRRRRHLGRRIGCAVGLLLLVMSGVVGAIAWLLLSITGVVGSDPLVRLVAGVGLVLGLTAVFAAGLAVRRMAAPAARLVEAARRIEEGDYSARVPVRGPSELRTLARAFNAMSGRLEADQAQRRSVLADVAHELRTPITVIRAQAEGIVDGVYSSDAEHMRPVLAATQALESLVDDLRTLALVESGSLQLRREPVDLGVLVHATLATFSDSAAAAGVVLESSVEPPGLTIEADAVRIRSVLANLVSNALRHGHRGGTVTVRASEAGDSVRVSVRDDGGGIPPELLPRVFDRFVKAPDSPGSGLGLAIVRDIVEAHGGRVAAVSTPADGTEITLTLPMSGRD